MCLGTALRRAHPVSSTHAQTHHPQGLRSINRAHGTHITSCGQRRGMESEDREREHGGSRGGTEEGSGCIGGKGGQWWRKRESV